MLNIYLYQHLLTFCRYLFIISINNINYIVYVIQYNTQYCRIVALNRDHSLSSNKSRESLFVISRDIETRGNINICADLASLIEKSHLNIAQQHVQTRHLFDNNKN
jgi:hypothetical protein